MISLWRELVDLWTAPTAEVHIREHRRHINQCRPIGIWAPWDLWCVVHMTSLDIIKLKWFNVPLINAVKSEMIASTLCMTTFLLNIKRVYLYLKYMCVHVDLYIYVHIYVCIEVIKLIFSLYLLKIRECTLARKNQTKHLLNKNFRV